MASLRYPTEHGTYYAYKHRCEGPCEACRQANTERAREQRRHRMEAKPNRRKRCKHCKQWFMQPRRVGRPYTRCPEHRKRR